MRKKTLLAAVVVLLVSPVMGLEASIQPSNPDDIVLDSGNSYEKTVTFDATASSGSIKSYSWSVVGTSKTDNGTEASFTFDRDSSASNTIRLVVSNQTGHTDVDEVTQILHDKPSVSENAGDNLNDIDIADGEVDRDYEVSDFSVTNAFDGPVSYSWDVSGSSSDDGTYTGNSVNVDFSETGNVDVKLTVNDSAGYEGSDTINVDVTNSSGSGEEQVQTQGGGGAPGTRSGYDETDYLYSLDEGEIEDAEFDDIPVTGIAVGMAETVLDPVAVQIRVSEEELGDPDSDPSGEVYRYIEINKVNMTDDDIDNATFSFQVEKSWFENNSIEKDSVSLERYDDGWTDLETEETDEDENYRYYEAESPGFSIFAVTGDEKSAEFTVEKLEVNATSIEPNETVKIDITLNNTGTAEGNYSFSFELAGEEFGKNFTNVAPGETVDASFVKKIDVNGSWTLEAGDKSRTVESSSGTIDAGTASIERQDGGFPWFIVGFVGLVVMLAGGVIIYVEKEEEIRPYIEDALDRFDTEDGGTGFSFDGFGAYENEGEEDNDDFDYSFEWDED